MRKKAVLMAVFILVLILNILFLINSQAAGFKKSDLCHDLTGCPDTDTRLCATIKASALGVYEVTLYCYEPIIRN